MPEKNLKKTGCPVARSLERVGEWWSILILRDAVQGLTRFDEFQKSLGIAPNMLTRRLKTLVESGLLERRQYSDHASRFDYVLTERGRDFIPVLWALVGWGNKHFAPEGPSLVIVDRDTGMWAEPVLVDGRSGKPMAPATFRTAAGPAASRRMRSKHPVMSAKSGARLVKTQADPDTLVRYRDAADE